MSIKKLVIVSLCVATLPVAVFADGTDPLSSLSTAATSTTTLYSSWQGLAVAAFIFSVGLMYARKGARARG